jgi:hypothetical protein
VTLPWLAGALLAVATDDDWLVEMPGIILMLSSPGTMVLIAEFGLPPKDPMPVLIALNTVAYGGVLVLFRTMCLNHADRLLGRAEGPPPWPLVGGVTPPRWRPPPEEPQ